MTAIELFANQPSTVVNSGGTTAPSPGASETWTVASSSAFPAASNSASPPTQFHVADIAAGKTGEFITVTNVSGTTWTVTRGAESTTPVAHASGFTIVQVVTAGALGAMLQTSFDATASDMQPTGVASTGKTPILKVAYADHVHPYQPWQFYVPAIGGGSDDTSNLRTAINNAMTYALANQQYAEVWLDPVLYTLASATLKTGTNQGNSQLPLNPVGNSQPPVRLVIRSTSSGAPPNPNFASGSHPPIGSGPVLLSTLTSQSFDGTYGAPSVIGGPTPQQGYGYNGGSPNFSNLEVQLDGITIMTQGPNPTMIGGDFRGITKLHASGQSLVDASNSSLASTQPTNSWAYGLTSPDVGNSDQSDIPFWTSYGYYWGLELSEHVNWERITCIYNYAGLALNAGSGQHGFSGTYYSAEANQHHVISYNGSSALLNIALMDCEGVAQYGGTGYHIDDTGGTLYGYVGIGVFNGVSNLVVNGCADLEIINYNQATRGHVTSPAVPATTVALTNPFWRHAWVIVSGGTVTGISVDGTATGLTSGAVRVPSGKTITLTYTAAPSWTWWLD